MKQLLKKLEIAVRWLTVSVILLVLIEEFVRVVWYVVGEWGILHAFIDGAVLYKIAEVAILIPFFLLIHWNGVWSAERLNLFVNKTRWLSWLGGVLALIAVFDLTDRVMWSWWMFPLMLMAVVLPPLMRLMVRKKLVWTGRTLATAVAILISLHYAFSLVLTGYVIAPLPSSYPSPADTAEGRMQQDLEYMADNLARLHLNAFHAVKKERFQREVARLHDAIPELNQQQIKVGFYRIAAMIGDGHTSVSSWGGPSSGRYPVRFYWLSDGLFVVAAADSNRSILGGKVLQVGKVSTDSAFKAVCTLLPPESNSYRLHKSVQYLINADLVRGLGLADDSGRMKLTVLTRDNDTIQKTLAPALDGRGPKLTRVPETLPSYRSHQGEEYWSEFFDDHSTAYLKYNQFMSPVAFRSFTDEFWAEVDRKAVEYVIVDFRENSGGYSACFDRFYDEILAHDRINRPGHLYHLTDRRTFSSASLYTTIIRRDTKAILAGEEMGGAPNHFGEIREFMLPNSHTKVSYSTKYFENWPDTLPPFKVDIPISLSSEDYFAAKDPVLDSVLRLIAEDIATSPETSKDFEPSR